MTDQVQTVDPEVDLLAALGDPEEQEEAAEGDEEVTAESEEKTEGDGEEGAAAPKLHKLVVKNHKDEDEEVEVDEEELKRGYLRQSRFSALTEQYARQEDSRKVQYSQALQAQHSEAVEKLNSMQELVLAQAAPELNGVDWVSLSVQDPAKFVQLQARQQQVQQTWQALEQQKTQHQQAKEQALSQAVDQVLQRSDEILGRAIPGLDGTKTAKLLDDVHKSIGWSRADIHTAAKALASAGMHPGTLGQVLVLAHKAIQFDELQKAKPAALKKVAEAPKVIKPSAQQPKPNVNKAAADRLKQTGRLEDLAKLL